MNDKDSSAPSVFDSHSKLFEQAFSAALPYDQFVATGTPQQQERWKSVRNALTLSDAQRALLASFTRELNLLVLAGVWCGDCSRQCPMLTLFETVNPRIRVRYLDNQTQPEVRDELRVCGGTRVPVVVGLSEDFFEVGRMGDRMLSVYRRKAKTELGASCDIGGAAPAIELAAEVAEWLEVVERWSLMVRLSGHLRKRHAD